MKQPNKSFENTLVSPATEHELQNTASLSAFYVFVNYQNRSRTDIVEKVKRMIILRGWDIGFKDLGLKNISRPFF